MTDTTLPPPGTVVDAPQGKDTIGLYSSPKPAAAPAPTVGSMSTIDGTQYFRQADGTDRAIGGNTPDVNAALKLSNQQKSPAAGIVGSSASVVAGENATKSTVAGLTAANPVGTTVPNDGTAAAQSASDSYRKTLADQGTALEQRRKDALANIESDFQGQQQELAHTQANETGVTGVQLARMGGFTTSASALGALVNLNHSHATEVALLEQKKQSAIQAANNAIDDKQFALAQSKAQEAKDIEKTINDRKEKFFSDSMSAMNEARSQDTANRQAIDDQLKAFSVVSDPKTIDPAAKQKIDSFYGVKGFTDNYLAVTAATNKAKSAKEQQDAMKSQLEFLKAIPAGQKVAFPDGLGGSITYTGMGSSGDITTFLQTDNDGTGHLISYDKGSRKVLDVKTIPGVGKTSTSSGKIDPAVKADATSLMQTNLEGNKYPTGTVDAGKYKADVYIEQRKLLRAAHPELLDEMDAKFLNPVNGFFSKYDVQRLRSKGIFFQGSGGTGAGLQDNIAVPQDTAEQGQ